MRRFSVPLSLFVISSLLALWAVPSEWRDTHQHLILNPDSDASTHLLRLWVAGLLCYLPFVGGVVYALSGTLTRYVMRQFVVIFCICMTALYAIWIVGDLNDNLDDLKKGGHLLHTAFSFYLARLPEVVVLLLPYSILLSTLYSLSNLSKTREIIAMVQTGRGMTRLIKPYVIFGSLAAIACACLNFQWAPAAMSAQKAIKDQAGAQSATEAVHVRFRNQEARRLWMVERFPSNFSKGEPLEDVFVVQEKPDGEMDRIISGQTATWNRDTKEWTFYQPLVRICRGSLPPIFDSSISDPLVIQGWKETPFEILRPGLPANQLGVPDLNDWLNSHPEGSSDRRVRHLTQWHYRWAQPINCLIVILLASPLGIYFSRRPTSGGIAVAIFLSAGLMFFTSVCLNLGDGGKLPPMLAAWLPNTIFGAISIYLCFRRMSGRPIYQAVIKLLPSQS
jgi:lipopolysaccharide export system permease protein